MRFIPGQRYKLTLHNTADRELPTQEMIDQMLAVPVDNIYVFPGNSTLNSRHLTNLHQHGIHISGQADADNVLKELHPGNCLTFNYIIPANHGGGTLWYHPHFHGKTSFQVIGGAFGMTIIGDTPQTLQAATGVALPTATRSFFTDPLIERNLAVYSMLQLWMGNGNPFGATVPLVRNQWHRIRVSYVRPEGLLGDAIFSPLTVGMACTMYEIAWDGVYASQVPYMATGGALPLKFRVHGAQRTDYALRCTTAGTVQMQYNGGLVALFVVARGQTTSATPFNRGVAWAPKRAPYITDLRDNSPTWTALKGVVNNHTMQVQLTPVQAGISWDDGPFQLLDQTFRTPIATMAYGNTTIHEINFQNTGPHPMHLHQQHYQVVQPGGCGPALKEGEFYDTISSEAPGVWSDCRVRFQFVDFSGPTIIHCHVLDHEDTGIVGWFDVPAGPGAFETTADFSNNNTEGACCVPRLDAVTNAPICRGVPSCIRNVTGVDTCNLPCNIPATVCARRTFCSTAGTCVVLTRRGRDALCEATISDEAITSTSTTVPAYPFVIMGVALSIAVVAVAAAVLAVRRNKQNYQTLFMEEVKTQTGEAQCPNSTPFATPAN